MYVKLTLNMIDMEEILEEIEKTTAALISNAETQLLNGNKAAGLRARRASLALEPLLVKFRKLSVAATK